MNSSKREPPRAMAEPTENTLPSRLRRYAQVSGRVAGQAAKIAGKRAFGVDLDRNAHAGELRAVLGGLKGPLMKVAQMLATIPDAIPKEYAAELAQLQSNAPPMGRPFVRRRMATELGADWAKHFREFPLDPAAAASLGQVHKATLQDGQTVACKLQYPNIAAAVDADLSQLRMALSLYRRYDNAIDPSKLYDEIEARLREELDYRLEAKHMGLYSDILSSVGEIHIPKVNFDLSTGRLLTMDWLDGKPLLEFRNEKDEVRNQIALNMFRAWYVPFYHFGVIHGDPHLGNYTIRPDLGINLLDFGCVRIFKPKFIKGVIDLYWAIARDDDDLARSAYELWGFSDLRPEVVDVLNEWARFLYSPLLEDRARLIEETNSGQYGRQVAGKVHVKLRQIGGVTPPREFVFMDRAAIGLGSVFMHLGAEINWYQMFMSLIEDFDIDATEERQRRLLAAHGLST